MGGGERIGVDVERLRVVNEPESDQQTLINKRQCNRAEWKRDDGLPSAKGIGRWSGEQSAKERSRRQDGDDEGLLGRGDKAALCCGIVFSEGAPPVTRGLDASIDTGVVANENDTESGEEGLRRAYDG